MAAPNQIYLVEWNDEPDYAYYAELSPDEKQKLTEKMEAADDISTFSIKEYIFPINSYEDMLDALEDWGVE